MSAHYPRTIRTHHDGHGLNDVLEIRADAHDPDAGGASHVYRVQLYHKDALVDVATIQFQHGPRASDTQVPGVTEAVLYAILIDRLRGFQSGPFACRENAIQLTKIEECLHWTKARADERARRGVLGKNEK
jgi:hypothetical protein